MASQQSDLLSVYQDILRNLTVNWQRAFSPTINFGCNVQDINAEQHVLNEVGSYGKQLNVIIDLLTVLLPRVVDTTTLKSWPVAEQETISRFKDLARRADEVARAYRGKPHRQIAEADVDDFLERLRDIGQSDGVKYTQLLTRIHKAPPADPVIQRSLAGLEGAHSLALVTEAIPCGSW